MTVRAEGFMPTNRRYFGRKIDDIFKILVVHFNFFDQLNLRKSMKFCIKEKSNLVRVKTSTCKPLTYHYS